MTAKLVSSVSLPVAAGATGLGFFLLGYGGILASGGQGQSVAIVWPATAFGMCMLLRLSRAGARDWFLLGAVLVGGLLANGIGGASPGVNLGYSLVNVLDVLAGVMAARAIGIPRLRTVGATLRFVLGVGVAPALLGGVLAALVNAWSGNPGWLASGAHWFAANLLGFGMLFPLGMTLSWRQVAKLHLERRIGEAAAIYGALAGVSLLAFRLSPYPMQFLVLMGVLISAVRLRVLGGGAGVLLAGLIALTAPGRFTGPDGMARLEMLQLLLAVCSIVAVRAAVVLNQRDLHLAVNERRRQRAARAARFKSELLSHVGGEARGPLSAIIGFSAMLESGALPAASAQEFAHVIAHNGELLQRLHEDLLDLSRADSGTLAIHLKPVELSQTLKTCLGSMRWESALGGKPVVLDDIQESLTVSADPARLAQIINNLIAGSYKYGDNHSPIHVTARRLADGFGRVEIVNRGPGIPPRERASLFRPTTAQERGGRRVTGAGLGLSLAKLLVERQGGRIAFQSEPGQTTRFWFDLPLAG